MLNLLIARLLRIAGEHPPPSRTGLGSAVQQRIPAAVQSKEAASVLKLAQSNYILFALFFTQK